MTGRGRQIPEGMQDLLPGACARKRQTEDVLRGMFACHGFSEVETPMLEYADAFGGAAQQQMWKTFDPSGHVLAIRPDSTTPIVRLAATHLREAALPLRLCYVQDVLAYPAQQHPQFCQATQGGVELLGDSSPDADAEVIALAIQALERCGLRDFQIDIGQVDFFKGLMEEAGLSDTQTERLRACVEQKNMLAMELMLRDERVGAEVGQRIMRLPVLYGGEEVLEASRGITSAPRCLAALDRIRRVLDALGDHGCRDRISIDLGMVHALHYYTGIIFRGITAYLGRPLLSGGRYDTLSADFDLPLPATGFGLDVGQLLVALERQEPVPPAPHADVLVAYAPASRAEALRWAARERQAGRRVALCPGLDGDAVCALAHAQGIPEARFFADGTPRVPRTEEG